MNTEHAAPVIWPPDADTRRNCQMGHYLAWLNARGFGPFREADYQALHQ